jgi:hypothetical protein
MSKEGILSEDLRAWPEKAREAWDYAERETRERPWRAVAVAAGAGYVLGGGLLSPLTARLLGLGLRVGLRASMVPLLSAGITQWASSLLERQEDDVIGEDDSNGAAGSSPRRRRRGAGSGGHAGTPGNAGAGG